MTCQRRFYAKLRQQSPDREMADAATSAARCYALRTMLAVVHQICERH